jgi:NAD+ diphosphatase
VPLPSFESFIPIGAEAAPEPGRPSWWFVVRGGDLLVTRNGDSFDIPLLPDIAALSFSPERAHVIGAVDGTACRVLGVPAHSEAPPGWSFEVVRGLFAAISDTFFAAAARALEIADWDRSHRFCGSCGSPTALKPGERALECIACGHLSYPRISPAVIVAVVRNDQILLARARRFPPGMYSVLAGFVEPGETLEECVRREVMEETGIEVTNLRYFSSQPWPFPHSLMIGFEARWAGGDIEIDPVEIMDAQWWRPDAMPTIPPGMSIARRLIDRWLERVAIL